MNYFPQKRVNENQNGNPFPWKKLSVNWSVWNNTLILGKSSAWKGKLYHEHPVNSEIVTVLTGKGFGFRQNHGKSSSNQTSSFHMRQWKVYVQSIFGYIVVFQSFDRKSLCHYNPNSRTWCWLSNHSISQGVVFGKTCNWTQLIFCKWEDPRTRKKPMN